MIDTSLVTTQLANDYSRALTLQESIRSRRVKLLEPVPELNEEYSALRAEINQVLGLETSASPLDAVGPLTEFEDSIQDPNWKLLTKWDGWLRSAISDPSRRHGEASN